MPYRIFEDSRGMEWQVWDIVPRLVERRATDADRRVEVEVIDFANRRTDERRFTNTPRSTLRGSFAQGWLAFDNGREKRRLTPIPNDWITCGTDRLEQYAREAVRVSTPYRESVDVLSEGDRLAEAG